VVVVYINRRQIIILDSCTLRFGADSRFHKDVRDEFIPNLTAIWSEVVKIDFGFPGYNVIFGNVPQRSENFSNDSGIFAMKNLELWDLNVNLVDKFCEDDVHHLRIKYVNDMIFNEFNYSDVGRSKVMEYDAEAKYHLIRLKEQRGRI